MDNTNTRKVSFAIIMAFTLAFGFFALPTFVNSQLASTLGVSAYAANKVIDIIATASNVASIIGIVAAVIGGGGVGVAVLATAKALIKRYGKAYAAAW